MLKNNYINIILVAVVLLVSSCKKEYESIDAIDDGKIQEYIRKNNLTMTKDPSGFYYQVTSEGTGELMQYKDSVLYDLDIKSLDGAIYQDYNPYSNIGTYLGYVTPTPFRTALFNHKRGSKFKLIIPSHLAFGKNGNGNIPSNEVIVSDVTTYATKKQFELDDTRIRAFLTSKNITATKHSSRVYYQVIQAGTGTTTIDRKSSLVVNYTGRYLNGTVFDSNTNTTFTLEGVIAGWAKVIPMFTSGAKIRIFVPSDLAYGTESSSRGVPNNSILDFDIEIVSVTNN